MVQYCDWYTGVGCYVISFSTATMGLDRQTGPNLVPCSLHSANFDSKLCCNLPVKTSCTGWLWSKRWLNEPFSAALPPANGNLHYPLHLFFSLVYAVPPLTGGHCRKGGGAHRGAGRNFKVGGTKFRRKAPEKIFCCAPPNYSCAPPNWRGTIEVWRGTMNF